MSEIHTQSRSHRGIWWLLPLLALSGMGYFLVHEFSSLGPTILVRFTEGNGLKVGDRLRYRGIDVGRVTALRLNPELDSITVAVHLQADAVHLARRGSRFWIMRPQINFDGVMGLETLVAARFMGVLPGEGEFANEFNGLSQPPWAELIAPGGTEVRLRSAVRGRLYFGAPVTYREVEIGTVTGVDLHRDASAVEVRLYVKPEYASLIRDTTRFWKTPALFWGLDLGGISWELGSLGQLLRGGVSLAVPPAPGKRVESDHLFMLVDQPQEEWTRWVTALPIHRPEPTVASYPPRLNAQLNWTIERFFVPFSGSRSGQVIVTEQGLLGPLNLFVPPEQALSPTIALLIDNQRQPLESLTHTSSHLGLLNVPVTTAPWPQNKQRVITEAEDILVVGLEDEPRFVSAENLRNLNDRWGLPERLFSRHWHGAAVISQQDGALIGLLIVDDRQNFVAPLP